MMERCYFSNLPNELRCKIIEELLTSHNEFRIGTQYVPRPLERTAGRRIYYKTSITLGIFQLDRKTRIEAISLLSTKRADVELRYCTREYVADINKLPASLLRDALNKSVVSAHLEDLSATDFRGLRTLFPRLEHLTFDILSPANPYNGSQIRKADGFSLNKDLISLLRGNFDGEFESLAHEDILHALEKGSANITGLSLEIPFRYTLPRYFRGLKSDHIELIQRIPGEVLVFKVVHDQFATKICSKHFLAFRYHTDYNRIANFPSVKFEPLGDVESFALQQSCAVNEIEGIDHGSHEILEILQTGGCGASMMRVFDSWLNDRCNYAYDFA